MRKTLFSPQVLLALVVVGVATADPGNYYGGHGGNDDVCAVMTIINNTIHFDSYITIY